MKCDTIAQGIIDAAG
jgi:succinyl-CoA synthetase beta subunit